MGGDKAEGSRVSVVQLMISIKNGQKTFKVDLALAGFELSEQ